MPDNYLIDKARAFASAAHKGQKRKYTGDEYIVHPAAVAELVASVTDDERMIAAAWLHDVIEDCDVSHETLKAAFGHDVYVLVAWLTDISVPSDGNREARKRLDRIHIGNASPDAQTIKIADLIDNSKSITEFDPGFARVYMKEKTLLLRELYKGNLELFIQAQNIVASYYKNNP